MSTFWAVFAPIPTGRERSPMRMPRTGTFRAVFAPVPRVEGMDGHVLGGFCARPPGGGQGRARFGRFLYPSPRRRAIPYANSEDEHVSGGFCACPPGRMPRTRTFRAVFVPVPRANDGAHAESRPLCRQPSPIRRAPGGWRGSGREPSPKRVNDIRCPRFSPRADQQLAQTDEKKGEKPLLQFLKRVT